MVHGKKRIPYWIDRRLTGLAGPDYAATISFGLPYEPEDSQYGESRINIGIHLCWIIDDPYGVGGVQRVRCAQRFPHIRHTVLAYAVSYASRHSMGSLRCPHSGHRWD